MSSIRLPAPPQAGFVKATPEDLLAYARALEVWTGDLVRSIETVLTNITTQAGVGYLPTNYTIKRDLDASTAVLADVANVLCTLSQDLKNRSIVG